MKAVLTLDNGEKFIADIYPLQGKRQHKPRFHVASTNVGLSRSLTRRSHELPTRW